MAFEIDDGVLKKYIPEESVKAVVIPDGVSAIESWAFYRCKEIETVSMPNSVTRIGQSAFKWCSNMKEIKFSESLTHIEACAFEECRNLTSIIIPLSIKEIGFEAFRNCIRLADISVPDGFTEFSSQVFENTRWEKYYPDDFVIINGLLYRYKGNEKSIIIPDSVKIIGQFAFAFSDIESVIVSGCVDEIRTDAFCGCKKLVSVILPDSIKKIEESTFYNCESLEKINLPDSIEEIGFEAFNGCRKLSDIKLPKNLKVLGTKAFKDNAWLKNNNTDFIIIGSVLSAYCGNEKVVNIPKDVTVIGDAAFEDCNDIVEIRMSDKVTRIGNGAFSGCAALGKIELSNNLKLIGHAAFRDCHALKDICIPESVTEMGNMVFANCEELTSIKLSTNLNQMGEQIFFNHAPELCVFVEKECFASEYAKEHEVTYKILEHADRKKITWTCLYKYIYTEKDWSFWGLFDFDNIKDGCAEFKKDIIWTDKNTEYYDFVHTYPGFKFSGDADFGDLKGIANLSMPDAEACMHKFPNFSLMPCTGGMNKRKGMKKSGYNDRFHVFIYVLSEYYKLEENQRREYVKNKLFGNGIKDIEENDFKKVALDALNTFLSENFKSIEDYCEKIHHLNTEKGKKFLEELIAAGREEIETQRIKYNHEDYDKYCKLATDYWKIKKKFLNTRLPKEYRSLIDKDIDEYHIE